MYNANLVLQNTIHNYLCSTSSSKNPKAKYWHKLYGLYAIYVGFWTDFRCGSRRTLPYRCVRHWSQLSPLMHTN